MQQKITAAIASPWFFYCSVGLLVVQACWIALTARYPQAFDEQFHFGITQLYAHQWSPFFSQQPSGADRFGALQADPSFLYHYLLSFPYRIIAALTNSLTVQIVVLRFINIGLFAWSLFIFRKLLVLAPASRALVHMVLLFFVLIPVVPLLAGQINYDNLFVPLTALSLLWTMRLVEVWRTTKIFPLGWTVRLLLLCAFTATVKYPFLPVFLTLTLVVLFIGWRSRAGIFEACKRQFLELSLARRALYGAALVAITILWTGVYGQNVIRYHTPFPACDKVLSVSRCMAYPPWGRDYQFEHNGWAKPAVHDADDVKQYARLWVHQILTELVFTISSNFEPDGVTVEYHVADPMPILRWLAKWGSILGTILIVLFSWKLWRSALFRISALVVLLYVGSLWADNFHAYLRTGFPVAIHGRYLLPLLPIPLLAIGLCCSWLFHGVGARLLPGILSRAWVAVAFFLILQGGGVMTYIIRSDQGWLGAQDPKAAQLTRAATKALKPVIIGY